MAKNESPSKAGQRGAPIKVPVRPRPKKKPPSDDRVKIASARRLGVPFVVVVAIVIVVVLIMAERSSNEVVTPKPSAKPGAPSQPAYKAPQTAVPAPKAPTLPPQAATPPAQPSTPPGAHRRAIPAEFKKALLEYAAESGGKAIALALANDGKWAFGSVSGFATEDEAGKEALSDCARYKTQAGVQENCKLYAVGNKLVW